MPDRTAEPPASTAEPPASTAEPPASTADAAPVPRVTIGMTLYNVDRYLPLALDSLLDQDYPDFEVVLVDNASTDGTWDIAERYRARDPRIRAYRNERNIGLPGNFRRLVGLARGELFKFHAHDDLAEPGLVRACVAALDAAGSAAVLAYPLTRIIDGDGRLVCSWRDPVTPMSRLAWLRVARWAGRFNLCNELFGVTRTSALRRTHLLLGILSADVVLLAELAARGRFVEVPQELFLRRLHAGGTIQGERTLDEVRSYLVPDAPARRSVRYPLLRAAARALWESDGSRLTRASTAAAFVGCYGIRQIGRRLRRYASRVRGTVPSPPPWEIAPAAPPAAPRTAPPAAPGAARRAPRTAPPAAPGAARRASLAARPATRDGRAESEVPS